MKTLVAILCGLGLAALLAACADLPAPETPAQRLAAAETTFTGVLEAAISARDAGLIERGGAAEASINAGVLTARRALDAAHAAVAAGQTESVTAWLTVALAALDELQRTLAAANATGQTSMGPPVRVVPGFSQLALAGG